MLHRTRSKAQAGKLPAAVPPSINRPGASPAAPLWLHRTVIALELALVCGLAYFLVQAGFLLLAPAPVIAPVAPASGVRAETARPDYAVLKNFDPFYRQVAVAAVSQAAAPESSLEIQLFGLRAGDQGQGSAIVRMLEDTQKTVAVGDDIAPGVRLVGVYADRIEITRRGLREAVFLRPALERTTVSAPVVVASHTTSAAAKGAGTFAALIAQAGLTPVRDGGRIRGFVLPMGDPNPLLAAAGLEGGDILLSVAGAPLTSFERLNELADDIQGLGALSIEIDRRGEVMTLSVPLNGQ